jgi:outer membrane protein assembly factor BamD (BamD/ComL family)
MRRAVLLIALLVAASQTAWASWGERYRSVHFNSSGPDFGTPPRRAATYDSDRPGKDTFDDDSRSDYAELSEERDDALRERRQRQRRVSRTAIAAAEARGDWGRARRLCQQEGETLGWTGSLRDRLEVLSAIVKLPQPLNSAWEARLRSYLHALNLSDRAPDGWNEAQATFERLHDDTAAGFLREHALYQVASLAYAWLDSPRARRLYQQLLREFPSSPKREAALIMIARCGILPKTADGRNLSAATHALDQFSADFPNSRFRRAALGLRARVAYLTGDYGKSAGLYLALDDLPSVEIVRKAMPLPAQERWYPRLLAAYLYRLQRTARYDDYVWALHQVNETMQMMTPGAARAFVARMKAEPTLAAPYFYYRLYYTGESADEDGDEAAIKRREQARMKSLLPLAEHIAAQRGDALPTLVKVRLAEVYYQESNFRDAVRWADMALQTTRPGQEPYARALFVRAASRHKQHRLADAIADFETLLARCPNSPLRPGTREELAILKEATGDLGGALDQYFGLGYDEDIAYLLDVRMPTATVAAYVAAHPHHAQRDLLRYSLGIRYLRDGDFSAARRNLRSVPRTRYLAFTNPKSWSGDPFDRDSLDPLTVIDELMELRKHVAQARSREARAMAAYEYASYPYKNGTLLFYNAALWKGERIWLFEEFWNKGQETAADVRAVEQHMRTHEVYAHSLQLCKQVYRDYPDTKAAPLALYRAACSASRLANMNVCWGKEANLEEQAEHLMRRLVRLYPKHPLASHARKYADVFAAQAREMHRWEQEARRNDRGARYPIGRSYALAPVIRPEGR